MLNLPIAMVNLWMYIPWRDYVGKPDKCEQRDGHFCPSLLDIFGEDYFIKSFSFSIKCSGFLKKFATCAFPVRRIAMASRSKA